MKTRYKILIIVTLLIVSSYVIPEFFIDYYILNFDVKEECMGDIWWYQWQFIPHGGYICNLLHTVYYPENPISSFFRVWHSDPAPRASCQLIFGQYMPANECNPKKKCQEIGGMWYSFEDRCVNITHPFNYP